MKRPAKAAAATRTRRKKSGASARAKKAKTAHARSAASAPAATPRNELSRASLTHQNSRARSIEIPRDVDDIELRVSGGPVKLTNLRKVFFPERKLTKRDLLQYYLDVSPWLLPHLKDRAMVMKRYPNGIDGEFFFMKRAPESRPASIPICSIEHHSGNVIGFPVIQHLASLLWVVNLGCIDLNPWYARCDDVDGPDYLHFDLDPVEGTPFERVLETSLIVRDALAELKIPCLPKTTGSRGIHVYVAIERGPRQKQVWEFAKAFSKELEKRHPDVITAEYRVAHRPKGRVLVDYNQNTWNRTLASVYSVRPKPAATVSTPVTWKEVENGIRMEDFTMLTVPARVAKLGDLWKPMLEKRGRVHLENFL
ncbi:MAG TPA: non-homologous end-joining DNA ligase [Candidatus Acidoferrales bacterium]|jgi:bifunctional non-homologous end joining protein LigD|nr:non-homologous end-joining DNA ligase [Candidatus Acidoferrales bacterium]